MVERETPIVGTCTRQVTAANEAAPENRRGRRVPLSKSPRTRRARRLNRLRALGHAPPEDACQAENAETDSNAETAEVAESSNSPRTRRARRLNRLRVLAVSIVLDPLGV